MPAVGDIFECIFGGRVHGQSTRTVLHARIMARTGSDSHSNAQFEDAWLAGNQVDGLRSQLIAASSSEWSLEFTKAQRVYPSPRSAGVLTVEDAGPGGVVGNSLPTAVAAVGRKRTEFAGRRYRGRVFFPGVPFAYEDDSKLNAGAIAAYAGVMDDLPLTINLVIGTTTYAVAWVLWHRKEPGTWDKIISTDIDPVLRTQRRRQVGKGI